MLLGSVFAKTLRDNRKSLFWWTFAILVFTLVNMVFYPDFKDQTGFNDLLNGSGSDALKAVAPNVTSFTTPEGFLNSQMYALMAPVLLLIYAATQATGAIAGEEGNKTLPLLLANPISRERIIIQKFAAIAVGIAVLVLGMLAVVAAFGPSFDLHFAFGKLVAVHLSLFCLALTFAAFALLIGSATGNRSLAGGVTGAVAVATYLLYTLGPLAKAVEPYHVVSPFYYYFENDPLTNGVDVANIGIMLATAAVLFGLAILAFHRRDITTT
jgi:ABC-2 type transport system permease protein